MNITLFLSIICSLLLATPTWAHPPSDIIAQYDESKGKLMLDIRHLSRDQNSHYIKKIEVQKNAESPQVIRPRQQVQPNGLYEELDYAAQKGDTFYIKAYCSQGGTKEVELDITEKLLKEPIIAPKKPDSMASTHPKDSKKLLPAINLDPDVAKPAVPRDPDKLKPAISNDPDVIQPAVTQGLDPYSSQTSTSSDGK